VPDADWGGTPWISSLRKTGRALPRRRSLAHHRLVASDKKQKSSSRRNSSISDNSQAQTPAADGPYRILDETTSQDVRGAQPSHPHQQQSFVDAEDYTSQDAGEHGHRPSSYRHKSHGPARPSYAPTPPRLCGERRKSTRSSPSLDDSANGIVQEHSKSSHGTTADYWDWDTLQVPS